MFAFIVLAHGLIHLLGFVKEWRLTQVKELTGKTLVPLSETLSRIVGVFWLLACLLFIVSVATYLMGERWWWIIAVAAIIVSQILIVIYWKDAKFGTVANVIVFVACILSYGTWSFNRLVNDELHSFLPKTIKEKKLVTTEITANLPPLVQKWLDRSNMIGRETIQTVHLKQRGEMKTNPNGRWMSVEAEQYFTVESPGFIWIADVQVAPYLHLAGRDKYKDGRGHMLIKLLSLFPIANAKGKETDQGTLLRYLAEIVWFPSAALSCYITWEEMDSTTAKATMNYGGITASGVFEFNTDGDIIGFEAQRYYDRKEGATLETWVITMDENGFREFEGIRVPAKSAVTWKLRTGDFTWYNLEITEIEYNRLTD